LQFITTTAYRCTKLCHSDCFHGDFVEVLEQPRQEAGVLLIG
jgi:hypothetical protein